MNAEMTILSVLLYIFILYEEVHNKWYSVVAMNKSICCLN